MILFDLIVLKQKMSAQEVSLLINQEHEIFYATSNLIILSIYFVLKKYNILVKGNVYNVFYSYTDL